MLRATIALLLLVLPTLAHADKRVALVIGNSAYEHTGKLANPKNDASDMTAALKKHGFQVIEGLDLDKAAFDRRVREFTAALKGMDAGVFFYAGHGLQVAGQNYLVPVDAKADEAAALDLEMVRVDVIHRIMEHQTKTNILFLDACRDNPLARNLARSMGTRSTEIGRGLAAVESGVGTLISFSTQPGNVALDGTGRNSPFAAALVKQLANTSDDLGTMLIAVRTEVYKATQGKQVPWEHSALMGRFYFGTKPAPPPPVPITEAAREWAWLNKESVSALETFVRRHPSSPEADYARARIDELSEAVKAQAVAADAERQRLALLERQEREAAAWAKEAQAAQKRLNEAQAEALAAAAAAAKKRADEETRAKVEADRKRVALLEQQAREAAQNAAEAEAQRKRLADAAPTHPGADVVLVRPGHIFRDCADCPEMVVVPAGSFMMGSPESENGRNSGEGPQRKVTITRPLAVGKFEVTFTEWDACVAASGCKHQPSDEGWSRGRRPVINVSWLDAKEYAAWLSRRTGKTYRLLSEAEWEYAARAGTTTRYAFGDMISKSQARFLAPGTVEVGSFPANRFGLHDMHGNVWEWVEDNWHPDYKDGAPTDGSVWPGGWSMNRVLRGGSWANDPGYLRSTYRNGFQPNTRNNGIGFRLSRTL